MARMSLAQRRLAGVLAAAGVMAAVFAYASWRLHAIGRAGWAGLSYYPAVSQGQQDKMPFFAMQQGSVMVIYPGGPAERAGMRRGDQIVLVDGKELKDIDHLTRLSSRVRYGDVVPYVVMRDDKRLVFPVRFGAPTETPMFAALFGATSAVAFIYIAIGLFVFWRKPRDPRAVIFLLMTLCAAITFVNTSVIPVESSSSRGLAGGKPSFAEIGRPLALASAGIFFAPLLLHLALIFPRTRPVVKRGRQLWGWIYGYPTFVLLIGGCFAAVTAFLASLPEGQTKQVGKPLIRILAACLVLAALGGLVRIVMAMRKRGWREGIYHSPFSSMLLAAGLLIGGAALSTYLAERTHVALLVAAMVILAIFGTVASFSAYPVATFVALYRSYRESNVEERRQVKWPLWGTMIAVGGRAALAIVGGLIGLLMTFRADVVIPSAVVMWPDMLAKLLYLLIPLSFAFAILKYRLMNIDVIIRRTVLYSILSAIVFAVYIALVAGVGTLLVRFTAVQSQTMVIASTIVVGLIAIPLRNRLQQMVDRNLFRERRDYPLALRNISNATGSEMQPFLNHCAEQIQQALQNRFVLIATRGETHYSASAKVGIADEILGTFRVPIADLPELNPQKAPPLRRLGTALVIPIRAHRESLGFIALGSKLSDQELDANDIEFLTGAASQIALGIENARLRTEETEYTQARAMQQILLPTHFPQLDGYGISGTWHPAHSVGGDYFDTIALGDNKVALCIADVAGKGMPAALLMANLQAAVKATSGPGVDPAQLAAKVKRVVTDNLAGGKFISFFYGILDGGAGTFTYTNAGHNPPILARAGGAIERLSTGGPVLCRLFRDDVHENGVVTLGHGDRLVLFTDGASEARHGEEEEFGEERLAAMIAANRTLSAPALQAAIAEAVGAFSGGELQDDLTLVVVAVDR
jgi:serine phosphatase RsbU (regulator of sigma subunit)